MAPVLVGLSTSLLLRTVLRVAVVRVTVDAFVESLRGETMHEDTLALWLDGGAALPRRTLLLLFVIVASVIALAVLGNASESKVHPAARRAALR
jgi:hypothetical protein